MYYDRQGIPSQNQWADLHSRNDYRVLAKTTINDCLISTVWLDLDHGFSMIFETMIFGGDLDGEQWRYTTEADAYIGHGEAIKKVLGE